MHTQIHTYIHICTHVHTCTHRVMVSHANGARDKTLEIIVH